MRAMIATATALAALTSGAGVGWAASPKDDPDASAATDAVAEEDGHRCIQAEQAVAKEREGRLKSLRLFLEVRAQKLSEKALAIVSKEWQQRHQRWLEQTQERAAAALAFEAPTPEAPQSSMSTEACQVLAAKDPKVCDRLEGTEKAICQLWHAVRLKDCATAGPMKTTCEAVLAGDADHCGDGEVAKICREFTRVAGLAPDQACPKDAAAAAKGFCLQATLARAMDQGVKACGVLDARGEGFQVMATMCRAVMGQKPDACPDVSLDQPTETPDKQFLEVAVFGGDMGPRVAVYGHSLRPKLCWVAVEAEDASGAKATASGVVPMPFKGSAAIVDMPVEGIDPYTAKARVTETWCHRRLYW